MRFGTDGVRGPADRPPIDADGARRVGAAAAAWARATGPEGVVVVGRDPRPSGEALAAAVCEGVASAGGRAVDVGVLASPGVAWVVRDVARRGGHATGVVVTASHNPAADNGFKVLGPGGLKPDDADVARLEAWLADPPTAPGGTIGEDAAAAGASYAAAFGAALGPVPGLAGRRLVVDLANGAGCTSRAWLRGLLRDTDVRWIGTGGAVNDGCGSEHPEALVAAVREVGADAGLAIDGDADRCLLVDATGRVVPGDALLALLASRLGVRRLAVSVMSSAALPAWLPGVAITRTPVGDRHLAALVARGAVEVGGEESGHVVLGDAWPAADGLLVGLRALALALGAGSLADAVAPFRPWPRHVAKVRAPRERVGTALDDLPGVPAALGRAEAEVAPGRVLVRWSGTEPVLRVLVEGPDAAVVDTVASRLVAACREAVG